MNRVTTRLDSTPVTNARASSYHGSRGAACRLWPRPVCCGGEWPTMHAYITLTAADTNRAPTASMAQGPGTETEGRHGGPRVRQCRATPAGPSPVTGQNCNGSSRECAAEISLRSRSSPNGRTASSPGPGAAATAWDTAAARLSPLSHRLHGDLPMPHFQRLPGQTSRCRGDHPQHRCLHWRFNSASRWRAARALAAVFLAAPIAKVMEWRGGRSATPRRRHEQRRGAGAAPLPLFRTR